MPCGGSPRGETEAQKGRRPNHMESRMTDRLGKITASQPLPDPKARAVVQGSGGEREVKGKAVPAFWT